jgi:6 kDa early secretory antigenic target
MSVATSGIRVEFGAIGNAQGDVVKAVANIDQQMADLRQFIAPLVASWEGAASTTYQALQKRWDTTAADLNAVLGQIGRMLGTTQMAYTDTEKRAGDTFSA